MPRIDYYDRGTGDLDEIEAQAVRQIDAIRREYEARIKPYIDRLVMIRSLRPPQPIYILASELDPAILQKIQVKQD